MSEKISLDSSDIYQQFQELHLVSFILPIRYFSKH